MSGETPDIVISVLGSLRQEDYHLETHFSINKQTNKRQVFLNSATLLSFFTRPSIIIKNQDDPDLETQAYNSSIWETELDSSSKQTWDTK